MMWGCQINPLMTKRCDVEVPPEPRDMTVSLAAANAKKAEITQELRNEICRYLMSGPASAEFIARHVSLNTWWTRKALKEIEATGKITYSQQGHKKVWRIK